MSKKVISILEGIAVIVLGILIAVLGAGVVVNNYLAIVCLVVGIVFILFNLYLFFKKQPILFAPLGLGAALISVAIGVFVGYISFNMLINILHFALMGIGAMMALYGIYMARNFNLFYGIFEVVLGLAILALCLCYYFIPDFRSVFWIIVGSLIAVLGGLAVVGATMNKKLK